MRRLLGVADSKPAIPEVVFTAPAKPGTHRGRLTIATGYGGGAARVNERTGCSLWCLAVSTGS